MATSTWTPPHGWWDDYPLEEEKDMSTCECDFDMSGDPGRYHRCNPSVLCPVHDNCEVCDSALAVLITEGTKVCAKCAVEDIVVCPNCGWDAGFREESSHHVERHGLDCGPYEEYDETRLICNHCFKPTDQPELDRINKDRLAAIKLRLKEMGQ